MNGVQDIIDSLAYRLGRPVGVDDRRFRAIAYSSHTDEIDHVRRASILGRRAPKPVVEWLEGLGLMSARDLVRVPANPSLGMVARVSIPVRFYDQLLGFVWLIEGDIPMSELELQASKRTATELAEELLRERQQTDEQRRLQARWVEQAVGTGRPDASLRAHSIAADAVYAAVCIDVQRSLAADLGAVAVRLTEAIDKVARGVPPRHQVAALDDTVASVVIAAGSETELDTLAGDLLDAAEQELADLEDASVTVGLGEATRDVRLLPTSMTGARRSAHLSRQMPMLGRLVRWSDLGATGLLAELVDDRDPAATLPASLRRLLGDPDGDSLVATLESYLEHGGDVAAAATELFMHRSSLYNRLHRIEEVGGVDIRSGADRLELHLGIRLWRMGGSPRIGPQ